MVRVFVAVFDESVYAMSIDNEKGSVMIDILIEPVGVKGMPRRIRNYGKRDFIHRCPDCKRVVGDDDPRSPGIPTRFYKGAYYCVNCHKVRGKRTMSNPDVRKRTNERNLKWIRQHPEAILRAKLKQKARQEAARLVPHDRWRPKPDLLTTNEVAEILGVTRQRVHMLHQDDALIGKQYKRGGKLMKQLWWKRSTVEEFIRNRDAGKR